MAQLASNCGESQEFWKPDVQPRVGPVVSPATSQSCDGCGADFLAGSSFCHICGAARRLSPSSLGAAGIREWLDLAAVRDAMGQSTGSLIALFLGIACIIAAAITGFLYTATTLLDWQAVQIWRIEWLLAALAVFAGGLLLKKK
jgi:hypothetical protein